MPASSLCDAPFDAGAGGTAEAAAAAAAADDDERAAEDAPAEPTGCVGTARDIRASSGGGIGPLTAMLVILAVEKGGGKMMLAGGCGAGPASAAELLIQIYKTERVMVMRTKHVFGHRPREEAGRQTLKQHGLLSDTQTYESGSIRSRLLAESSISTAGPVVESLTVIVRFAFA